MFGVSVGIMDAGGAGGAAGAFESIATATGTGSSATITFSSIPSTYKHLQIRALTKNTDAGSGFSSYSMTMNGDSALNYPYHRIFGNGSSIFAQGYNAANGGNGVFLAPLATTGLTNIFGTAVIDIIDYASSTKNKTVRSFVGADSNGSGQVVLTSSVWLNTNAVTSLSFITNANNWATGTTISLYGIKGE